ncbi:MAG: hypothetical protein KatS3mg051_0806 [Anaerolineae bacterium]|nr:MAG: hypothetical protein KatS3mg051_0806 [Anaerolineae bacterium]
MQQDLEDLLGWATEFAENVNVSFPPTGDEWALMPEEAIIPARLLALNSSNIDELLDLLSDISLTMERPVSIHLLLNAHAGVQPCYRSLTAWCTTIMRIFAKPSTRCPTPR